MSLDGAPRHPEQQPRRRGRGVRITAAGIAIAALVAVVALLPAVLRRGDPQPDESDPRPNVIVILTDDQSADSIPRSPSVMPYLQGRLMDPADHWVVFRNGYVNTPLCCPSRTTMLTGRYAHHSGVQDNEDGHLIDESATLATWLDGAGYTTGLVGKYLNLYPFGRGPYVPQGWDRWWGKEQGTVDQLYQDYTLIEQGVPVHYGSSEADYATDVMADKALQFLREASGDRPFFLWFAPTAPHPPWVSAPRDEDAYADLVVPTPPSVGEADVSDKPAWVRDLPRMDASDLSQMRDFRRRSYEALLAVDDAVRAILEELDAEGELDDTVIVYLSDNGFSFGEHRWVNKTCPYEACLRVPFFVRMPGTVHRVDRSLVSAVDLAPTIAELAGVEPTIPMDGVSLAALLARRDRSSLPGEVFGEWVGDDKVPGWWEVRTSRFAYIELATGERELYALRTDPFELVNVVNVPSFASDLERLASALAAQRAA